MDLVRESIYSRAAISPSNAQTSVVLNRGEALRESHIQSAQVLLVFVSEVLL